MKTIIAVVVPGSILLEMLKGFLGSEVLMEDGMIGLLSESENVQFGNFDDLFMIQEWSPMEPEVIADKYFAKGVGVVLEIEDSERVELQEMESV